jgi:hypothetical protein
MTAAKMMISSVSARSLRPPTATVVVVCATFAARVKIFLIFFFSPRRVEQGGEVRFEWRADADVESRLDEAPA